MATSQKNTVLLVGLLVIVVLAALYYYVILPKSDYVDALQKTVETMKSELATTEAEIATFEDKLLTPSEAARLEKQVPLNRDVAEILRDLEDIEMLTRSRIEAINFSEHEAPLVERKLGLTETSEEELAAKLANEEVAEEDPLYQEILADAPQGLQIVTYQVELLTPDYKTLRTFIREVEGLTRIVKVDMIKISQPGEEVKFEEVVDYTVSASLQLTTFFYNE